jgi:hypothetical protein
MDRSDVCTLSLVKEDREMICVYWDDGMAWKLKRVPGAIVSLKEHIYTDTHIWNIHTWNIPTSHVHNSTPKHATIFTLPRKSSLYGAIWVEK